MIQKPKEIDLGETSDSEDSEISLGAHTINEPCFFYDTDTPPTCIEKIFGEPFHVKDSHWRHQITIRFILTLGAVYMVEGCLDWTLIAFRYYGAAVWNIGPAEMQNFYSIIIIPWSIKLLYGLLIDSLPLCGYKRKSYMILFGVLGSASMLLATLNAEIYHLQLIFITLSQLSIAFCDVIADALTVERTEFKSHSVATRLQSFAWGSRSIASITGLLISTRIQTSGEPHDILNVYWLYFGVSLTIPICGILLPESRQDAKDETIGIKRLLYLTFETLCRKSIFYPLLFVFILFSTPSSGEALNFYLIYHLGFDSIQIGYLAAVGSIAFLISIAIITFQSRKSNDNFSLRRMYLVWTLIATILPFITLVLVFGLNAKINVPDFMFMVSDTVVVGTAKNMLQMGINILFARICPPGIEGVFMTVLTSIANIAQLISYQISSALVNDLNIECEEDELDVNSVSCDFDNLWKLIVIVNLTTLIPLVLIRKVPDEQQLQEIGKELEQSTAEDGTQNKTNGQDMISFFRLVVHHILPFFKSNCCSCGEVDAHQDKTINPKHNKEDGIYKDTDDTVPLCAVSNTL